MSVETIDRTRTSEQVPVRCGGCTFLVTAELRLRGEGGQDWFLSLTFRTEPGGEEVQPMTYHQLKVGDMESFAHKCDNELVPSGIAEVINLSGLGEKLDFAPYGATWMISAEFAYRCLNATRFLDELSDQWERDDYPSYAWEITRNLMPDLAPSEHDHVGATYWEDRGRGPQMSPCQVALLDGQVGTEFLLLDDDDNHLLMGVYVGDWRGMNGFSPKDDWAEAEFGATEIRFKQADGTWQTL
jgi:hypothetical protein